MKHALTLRCALAVLLVAAFSIACASKQRAVSEPVTTPEPTSDTTRPLVPEEVVEPGAATIPSEEVVEELPDDIQELNRRGFLKDVFFDTNKYDLRPEARELLAQNAAWLQRYPTVKIVVEGHCDERNTREYNLALGSAEPAGFVLTSSRSVCRRAASALSATARSGRSPPVMTRAPGSSTAARTSSSPAGRPAGTDSLSAVLLACGAALGIHVGIRPMGPSHPPRAGLVEAGLDGRAPPGATFAQGPGRAPCGHGRRPSNAASRTRRDVPGCSRSSTCATPSSSPDSRSVAVWSTPADPHVMQQTVTSRLQ